ncbi:MAG: Type II secretory pathway, pullulanase PulA [Rhodobacteraceae bacterium]|nr:Type II secretory pathway, pullulanase PulA [Paracoccaceae bacterium]
MILSPGRSYVFIHIPKTGGTALALALEARAMADDMMLGDTPKARKRRRRLKGAASRGRLWKHSTLADIEGLIPTAELEAMFAFTLVRNPWDRAVSYYHWLKAQSFNHTAVRLARDMEFPDFVCHPFVAASYRDWPSAAFMRDSQGRERCDLFIRLEHFDTDAQPLFDHLGFELNLEHVNPSDRDLDYRGYFTPVARDAVAESCAEDIRRFGYAF